jgi:mono/diheme cytochrome c family protein
MKYLSANNSAALSGFAALASLAIALLAGATVHPAPTAAAQKNSRYKYQDDALVYAELAKAPEKAKVKRNPMATDPDAIAAGANLFDQHCAECHGDAAEGSRKGPSLLKEQVQTAAPGALFWLLTNGVVRRGMPVWSKLPEPQRWQLVTYIKSLVPPAPASATAPVDPTKVPSPQ